MSKKPVTLNKNDFERVLLTETLPNETPIIFSNSGLYERVKEWDGLNAVLKKLIEGVVFSKHEVAKYNSTIPYNYKIKKDSKTYRQLSLLHPFSQWKIKEFYEKYSDSILYHCSQSPASIRAPRKISGSFYLKNSLENLNQYKNGSISLESLDELTKHSPTFFAYKGYNRLYKFFESKDYFELEKQFSNLLTLDVSKCFNSIYTHSMSWAIKDKPFTKQFVSLSSTFAQQFDVLMTHSNHNETSGIVIGPEISRIFAEIILQEVDRLTIKVISEKHGMTFGKDYSFRRYVDDVYFFSKSKETNIKLYEHYSENLIRFNLHSNDKKSIETERPFVTQKSRLIHAASLELNKFIEKFLIDDDFQSLKPRSIRSVWNLTRSFIDAIKSLCLQSSVNYDEISTFIISVLSERTKKIVAVSVIEDSHENSTNYKNAFLVILDVCFFFYKVSPSVNASYKLCTTIILMIRFCKKHLKEIESTLSQRIYDLSNSLIRDINHQNDIEGFVALEAVNLALTLRELGDNYLISEETVRALFLTNSSEAYFKIISCLSYIRDNKIYRSIKKEIIDLADKKLSDYNDLHVNAERAYLLFDLITCPFIEEQKKRKWIREAYKAIGFTAPSKVDINDYLATAHTSCFHIDWNNDVDLLNYLEKKELKQAY